MEIIFNNADGLATKNDEPLKKFSIAGEDHIFYLAQGTIKGNKVILSNPKVKNPVAVSYAWAQNPICNNVGGYSFVVRELLQSLRKKEGKS